jgi:hypothetical protein
MSAAVEYYSSSLIAELERARLEGRYMQIIVDCLDLSDLGRNRIGQALRVIDEALEWALADLEIPAAECTARDAAA